LKIWKSCVGKGWKWTKLVRIAQIRSWRTKRDKMVKFGSPFIPMESLIEENIKDQGSNWTCKGWNWKVLKIGIQIRTWLKTSTRYGLKLKRGRGTKLKNLIFFKMQKWHRPIYGSLPLSFFLAIPQKNQREYGSLGCINLHTSHQTGQQTCLPYSLAFVPQPSAIKYKLCSP